jgi:hypothetical protein
MNVSRFVVGFCDLWFMIDEMIGRMVDGLRDEDGRDDQDDS